MNLAKYETLKFLIQASVNFLTSVKLTKSNIVKFVFASVRMLHKYKSNFFKFYRLISN